MTHLDYRFDYRRKLPHFQPPGATLFVTFRLAGSLPADVVSALQEERRLAADDYTEQRRYFGRWDTALDESLSSPRWLADARIARLVHDSTMYRDGRVYGLDAFCLMPNHVHMVFTPLTRPDGSYYGLASIMQSLKGYTARKANSLLGRTGHFWAPESYDHVVRDHDEKERILRYVLNNPVKAGLVDDWREWEWAFSRAEVAD